MARGVGRTMDGRRLAPLRVGPLAGAALRTVGEGFPGLWPLAVAWFAVNVALIAAVHALFPQLQALGALGTTARGALQGVVHGAGSAVAMRSYLGGSAAGWRPKAGLFGYVAIVVGLTALEAGAPAVISSLLAGPTAATQALAALRAALGFGAGFIALWVAARSALWTIGVLMGDGRPGLIFGWRAMGGAVFAYLLAYALLGGPAYVADVVAASWYYQTAEILPLLAAGVAYTALGFVTSGLHVEAYRQRLGPADQTLSEVFA